MGSLGGSVRAWDGRTRTNMDEHGQTWTNMDEHGRTRTNTDSLVREHGVSQDPLFWGQLWCFRCQDRTALPLFRSGLRGEEPGPLSDPAPSGAPRTGYRHSGAATAPGEP